MKSKVCALIYIITLAAWASMCWAGIPEPDVILYGTVTIDGVLKGAGDDVSVVARVSGVPGPVGSYHMGDDPNTGDNYVLRIQIEDLNDGSSQSDNAALIGQTIDVYLSQGAGPEFLAGSLLLSSKGHIQNIEYNITIDTDEDGMPDYWENQNGLDPNIDDSGLDADDDGLSNIDEFYTGTAANNPDSEGDGMTDGWEVANLLNPLVNDAYADADSDGYTNLEEFLRGTLPGDSGSVPVAIAIYVDDNAFFDPGPGDPCVSDPDEGGTMERPFDSIQEGIDYAIKNDTVVIADGNYNGPGNRGIDLLGKPITVMSANWATHCIIDCQNLGRAFYLHSGEDANSVIDGFTIINGYADNGGAVYCQDSSPTLLNCIIAKNTAQTNGGGLFCTAGAQPNIINLTIARNQADGHGGAICCEASSNPRVLNSILWDNAALGQGQEICLTDAGQADLGSTIAVLYSRIPSGPNDIYEGDYCLVVWGEGNIDINPCFVNPNNEDYHLKSDVGYWNPNAHPATDLWVDGFVDLLDFTEFASSWQQEEQGLDADFNRDNIVDVADLLTFAQDYLTAGTPGAWVDGLEDLLDFAEFASSWRQEGPSLDADFNRDNIVDLVDLHTFAQDYLMAGTPGAWLSVGATSRCIDAGNPATPLMYEPRAASNVRINMGAYGGTLQASCSPQDWSLLADLNNDGTVDFVDLAHMAYDWLQSDWQVPGDLSRDGTVDNFDLLEFTTDWLQTTNWHD